MSHLCSPALHLRGHPKRQNPKSPLQTQLHQQRKLQYRSASHARAKVVEAQQKEEASTSVHFQDANLLSTGALTWRYVVVVHLIFLPRFLYDNRDILCHILEKSRTSATLIRALRPLRERNTSTDTSRRYTSIPKEQCAENAIEASRYTSHIC